MKEPLAPHEQRVIEEKDQLEERLGKLLDFLGKGKPSFIDDANWNLLNEQFDAMNRYHTILLRRIDLFK